MKPDYRIELRVYDDESGETLDREDTYLGDLDLSPFEMAEVCLGRLERRLPKRNAQHLAELYPEPDDEE